VARAAPDGYALGIGHIGTHVINAAVYQLPFDVLKDLEPVAMIATNPQVIISKNAVPAKDLKELLAWVKSNQERVSIGTGAPVRRHMSAGSTSRTSREPKLRSFTTVAPRRQRRTSSRAKST